MKRRQIKRVLLIGRGAVGTVMGSILQKGLQENFAFLVDPQRKERYTADPLQVNGTIPAFRYVSSPEEFGPADLILIATKYGALPAAIAQAAAFVDDQTIFMPCINGLKSEEDLRKAFPAQTTLRTIAQKMDACCHDNRVDYSQTGELVFGADDPLQQEAVEAVCTLFDSVGLPYICSKDIVHDQWSKLMLNCGINQTCAAWDATYGQVLEQPELKAVFVQAMEETAQVGRACGLDLQPELVESWVQAVAALDPNSMPSMLQDVRAGRKTEEELFSAYVIELARQKGVDVPVLAMLKEKVDALDARLA